MLDRQIAWLRRGNVPASITEPAVAELIRAYEQQEHERENENQNEESPTQALAVLSA
jgi:hypothetical protein